MPVEELKALGVEPGAVLLVHCAFSRVAPAEGRPQALIAALRAAIGPSGTLVMPSMADDDDVPFDPSASSCRALGIVADTFWRMPGVLRSNNPHAFAAHGPHAARITAPHPIDIPHGIDSPPGRLYELDGQVLLLGVGHDCNTTVHAAEHLARVRYRLSKYATVMENGRPRRYEYGETDHCCERFALLDGGRSPPRLFARHRRRGPQPPARGRAGLPAPGRIGLRGVQPGKKINQLAIVSIRRPPVRLGGKGDQP